MMSSNLKIVQHYNLRCFHHSLVKFKSFMNIRQFLIATMDV